jgi:hypothetical protein
MFEGITCVYKSNVDLLFYVFGSASENELILASVRALRTVLYLATQHPMQRPRSRHMRLGWALRSPF